MNFIQIAGHLGADPETRFTPSGQKVTTLRLATNVRRGGKDETVWWRVTIWGERFDKMISYLKKGSGVIVWGEMGKPEIYTDKEGKQQVSLEVTAEVLRFNPFGKSERSSQEQQQSNPQGSNQNPYSAAEPQGGGYHPQGDYSQNQGFNSYGRSAQGQSYQKQSGVEEEEPLPF